MVEREMGGNTFRYKSPPNFPPLDAWRPRRGGGGGGGSLAFAISL